MLSFLKKNRKRLLLLLTLVLLLTAVFFLADGPEMIKPTSSFPGEAGSSSFSDKKNPAEQSLDNAVSLTEASGDALPVAECTELTEKSVPPADYSGAQAESALSGTTSIGEKPSSVPESTERPESEDSVFTEASVTADMSIPVSSAPEKSQPPAAEASAPAESQPAESSLQPTEEALPSSLSVTFMIECSVLLDQRQQLPRNKQMLVPGDGVILSEMTVDYTDGESVFDLTKRICRDRKIPLEFTITPLYHTAYIEGMNNLYEFDCGSGSGWVYSVNEKLPGVGCSDYRLQSGDRIVWHYTCQLGNDLNLSN